ncbi:MarR family winged helix-turn-helix transcriptional regulator [Nocardioides sp. Kera G14]|uniref:MarR family winged helix-turn-helix transcriptional regulator n=1 Tax=Nocardioides sp. Kera G14 TaxID=2884264 RepID=UPI001D1119E1|nr:MarR family transcriptional regulator [Nocardioides sp. Kera G14]UDY23636.1 MarR family transcriptional regulator [Nocardioides sp. Kera G14]
MTQDPEARPLNESLGYVLKQAQMALHAAMDAALRPVGLTLSQYSVLELLSRAPGQSNAQLARGAFVTAQSMNEVLRGLQERGLVERPANAVSGRSRPAHLTRQGEGVLREAHESLRSIEHTMDQIAAAPEHDQLLPGLRSIITALGGLQPLGGL